MPAAPAAPGGTDNSGTDNSGTDGANGTVNAAGTGDNDPADPPVADQTGFGAVLSVTSGAVGEVVDRVADQVEATVKPAAVASVATTFSFPLVLMLAVLLFLLVQNRLDGRDPKLRATPLAAADSIVAFVDETDC